MNANEIKSPMGVTVEELKKTDNLLVDIYYGVKWNEISSDLKSFCLSLSDALDAANKRIAELITKLNSVEDDYIEMEKRSLKRIAELEAKLQPSPQPEAIDSSHLTKEWARSEARRETEADETPKPQVGETWHTANDGDVIIRKVRDYFVDVSHVKKPDEIAGAISIRHLTSKSEVQPVELKPGMIWRLNEDTNHFAIVNESILDHHPIYLTHAQHIAKSGQGQVLVNNQWLEVSTGKPVQP